MIDKDSPVVYSIYAMGVSWFRQVVCWIQSAVEWRPNCQKTFKRKQIKFRCLVS